MKLNQSKKIFQKLRRMPKMKGKSEQGILKIISVINKRFHVGGVCFVVLEAKKQLMMTSSMCLSSNGW